MSGKKKSPSGGTFTNPYGMDFGGYNPHETVLRETLNGADPFDACAKEAARLTFEHFNKKKKATVVARLLNDDVSLPISI